LVQRSAFALFGDFARLVKHMRFPAQPRESLHFRASTRTIVKRFFSRRAAGSAEHRRRREGITDQGARMFDGVLKVGDGRGFIVKHRPYLGHEERIISQRRIACRTCRRRIRLAISRNRPIKGYSVRSAASLRHGQRACSLTRSRILPHLVRRTIKTFATKPMPITSYSTRWKRGRLPMRPHKDLNC
jgi:hypothetical protein